MVSRSSYKSKYNELANITYKAIRLRSLIQKLKFEKQTLTTIWFDNQSLIKLSKNQIFYDKTKHFENDLYFVR